MSQETVKRSPTSAEKSLAKRYADCRHCLVHRCYRYHSQSTRLLSSSGTFDRRLDAVVSL
ncbi:MAG: hypothetical protein EAZ09_08985 [Oscillatoriales cyanobacterium]|nr:MAG: hypothetical protein EAZ18_07970 [Oscillatoriales cyanobacterium]TAH23006.1 MAG: hypothetical protein EAZ09_08985 [Oscillatoriales cyanobacterium]